MKKHLFILIIISLNYCKVNTETGSGPELLLISALTKLAEVKPTVTTDVYTVSTFAGSGTAATIDGTGTSASFNAPVGLAIDSNSNLFVTEAASCVIRKVTSQAVVTTLAGSGSCGFADGTGTSASFNVPHTIAIDSGNNLIVPDSLNFRIRKITMAGVVTTFAGSGTSTLTDGTGTSASFRWPKGIAIDSFGFFYVSDYEYVIRKISSAGVVTTLAGTDGVTGNADGTGTSAKFNRPFGVVADNAGSLYVADENNNSIRKITINSGVVSTYSGSTASEAGNTDGTLSNARFSSPNGLVFDSSKNLFIVDRVNNKIRKISSDGNVTTIAGTGTAGSTDGDGSIASFNNPKFIVIDKNGNLFLTESFNHKIRKITITKVTVTK